jgi:hypothetical protein
MMESTEMMDLVILDGVKSNAEVGEWLNSFQKEVNKVTGYKLQRTGLHSQHMERDGE